MRIYDGSQAGKAVAHVKKQVLGKVRASWCCIFKTLPSCPIFKKTTALEKTAIVSLQEIRDESLDQQQTPWSFTTTSLVSDSESKVTSRDSREYSTGLGASKISSSCSSFANVSTTPCNSLAEPSHRSIPSLRYEAIDYKSLDCTPYDEAYVCLPANLVQCNRPRELIEQVRFHQIS